MTTVKPWSVFWSIIKTLVFCAAVSGFTQAIWFALLAHIEGPHVGAAKVILSFAILLPLNSVVAFLVSRSLVSNSDWPTYLAALFVILLFGLILPIDGPIVAAIYLMVSIASIFGARSGRLQDA